MFYREDVPADESVNNSLRILRAPAKGNATFLITSTKVLGTRNHFYGGKTVPCMLGECEPCRQGLPWRWAGYFGIWHPPTNEHAVCEVPAAAGKKIAQYREEHGIVRGVKITLFRAGNRVNGRVLVNLAASDASKVNMPKELDLEVFLCNLWNIALENTGRSPERGGAEQLSPCNFSGRMKEAIKEPAKDKDQAEADLVHLVARRQEEMRAETNGNT